MATRLKKKRNIIQNENQSVFLFPWADSGPQLRLTSTKLDLA